MTNNELTARIAEVVRERAAAQGKSVNRLVTDTGISYSTLSRRVSGLSPFTTEELGKVAIALGTTFGAIVTAADTDTTSTQLAATA